MKKMIVVGDLHGQYEIVEAILAKDGYKVCFIGDYLDSFDRQMIEQLHTLNLVLGAIRKEPDRVWGLKGNHELSYLDPKMQCSGYSYELQNQINYTVDMSPLLDYIWVDDWLISHAGVSQKLLDALDMTLEEYLDAGDFNQIGRARGGRNPIGGLFWCDWWHELEPIPTPQIVGHSHHRPDGYPPGPVQKGNAWNIDCLGRTNEVLVLDHNIAEVWDIDEL